jgi:hypothetical protein
MQANNRKIPDPMQGVTLMKVMIANPRYITDLTIGFFKKRVSIKNWFTFMHYNVKYTD